MVWLSYLVNLVNILNFGSFVNLVNMDAMSHIVVFMFVVVNYIGRPNLRKNRRQSLHRSVFDSFVNKQIQKADLHSSSLACKIELKKKIIMKKAFTHIVVTNSKNDAVVDDDSTTENPQFWPKHNVTKKSKNGRV